MGRSGFAQYRHFLFIESCSRGRLLNFGVLIKEAEKDQAVSVYLDNQLERFTVIKIIRKNMI